MQDVIRIDLKRGVQVEKRYKKLTRAERYDVQVLGRITLESSDGKGESYICNTLNVSLSGALVETGSLIPMGSLLKYSFCMPGFTIPVNVIGEVVRGEKDDEDERKSKPRVKVQKMYRYGIIFLDMRDEDKKAMESYLIRCQNMPPQPDPGA